MLTESRITVHFKGRRYKYLLFFPPISVASCHPSPSPRSSKEKAASLLSMSPASRPRWRPARTAATRTKWSMAALKGSASRWTRRTRRTRVMIPWATETPTGNYFGSVTDKSPSVCKVLFFTRKSRFGKSHKQIYLIKTNSRNELPH